MYKGWPLEHTWGRLLTPQSKHRSCQVKQIGNKSLIRREKRELKSGHKEQDEGVRSEDDFWWGVRVQRKDEWSDGAERVESVARLTMQQRKKKKRKKKTHQYLEKRICFQVGKKVKRKLEAWEQSNRKKIKPWLWWMMWLHQEIRYRRGDSHRPSFHSSWMESSSFCCAVWRSSSPGCALTAAGMDLCLLHSPPCPLGLSLLKGVPSHSSTNQVTPVCSGAVSWFEYLIVINQDGSGERAS